MINTKRPKNCYWTYDDAKNGFTIEATRDIGAGEQIFDSYGSKCNYRFFMNYGFINLDDDGENEDNEYPMKLGLDKNDKGYDIKQYLFLGGIEDTEAEYRLVGNFKEKVLYQFLAWTRFVVYDGDLDLLYDIVEENMAKTNKTQENKGEKK